MDILEINKGGGYIYCEGIAERQRIAKLLHEAKITHITSGPKTYQDYLVRETKGNYEGLFFIGMYKSDFFSILDRASMDYPIYYSINIK